MKLSFIILIIASVLLSSVAQVMLKLGVSDVTMTSQTHLDLKFKIVFDFLKSPSVILGLFLYFSSAVVWLLVLSKAEVSYVYPFVSLGFIFTMVLASIVNGEPITLTKLIGTLIIVLGVVVIAQGKL